MQTARSSRRSLFACWWRAEAGRWAYVRHCTQVCSGAGAGMVVAALWLSCSGSGLCRQPHTPVYQHTGSQGQGPAGCLSATRCR
jgi:hypothetical protein